MNIIVAILILGIIIIIHELGHFLLAKKNGITVTEFSVGMGPRIASFVRNGTRYSLKALPFGGSCMMLGEDETIDDSGAFGKKGVWARFSVIFAGAFFNFILAFVLALIVLGADGVALPKIVDVKEGSSAAVAGLQEGDLITEIDGSKIHFGKEISLYLYFNPLTAKPFDISYKRDGKSGTTTITPELDYIYRLGCTFDQEQEQAVISIVEEDYPLKQSNVLPGDIITGINNTKIATLQGLAEYLYENKLTDEAITLTYLRNGEETKVNITPKKYSEQYVMGLDYNTKPEKVSAFDVVKFSIYELRFNINYTMKSIVYLVTGKVGVDEIAGPIGIVNAVGQMVDASKTEGIRVTILSLLSFCILLSANLGVMNLLPLPALDGGRLVFILIEAIFKKPVPKEKEAMVHMVGLVLLMVLMVFVLFNDIKNIFG